MSYYSFISNIPKLEKISICKWLKIKPVEYSYNEYNPSIKGENY